MATDAEIRAKGIKFLPLQKYLQNPYEFPAEEETAPVPGGITNTNAFNNSGGNDGFSVYNPDPNSIVNREYRPNYDYRQFSEYGSDPSTADIKITSKIKIAGDTMDIKVLDHIIIAGKAYYGFADNGVI